jgi:hypothetical protein
MSKGEKKIELYPNLRSPDVHQRAAAMTVQNEINKRIRKKEIEEQHKKTMRKLDKKMQKLAEPLEISADEMRSEIDKDPEEFQRIYSIALENDNNGIPTTWEEAKTIAEQNSP